MRIIFSSKFGYVLGIDAYAAGGGNVVSFWLSWREKVLPIAENARQALGW
jgi:hypothetical protein